jgi:hypothetical protein
VDGFAILQSHHTQVFANFGDVTPVSNPAIRLDVATQGIPDDTLAPLHLQVRAFAKYLFLEIARCFHLDDVRYWFAKAIPTAVASPLVTGYLPLVVGG